MKKELTDKQKEAFKKRNVYNSETGKIAGSKGGKAKAKKQKEEKLFKDLILDMLKEKIADEKTNKLITKRQYIAGRLVDALETLEGDKLFKCFEIIRDTIGEKPVDRVDSETKITGDLKGLEIEIIKQK